MSAVEIADRWTAPVGIALLALAKAADVGTTVIGLSIPGVVESNPIAAGAIATVGVVPALLGVGALVVCAVVVAVEGAARVVRSNGHPPSVVAGLRAGSYGALTVLWTAVAGQNLALLAGVIA